MLKDGEDLIAQRRQEAAALEAHLQRQQRALKEAAHRHRSAELCRVAAGPKGGALRSVSLTVTDCGTSRPTVILCGEHLHSTQVPELLQDLDELLRRHAERLEQRAAEQEAAALAAVQSTRIHLCAEEAG